MRFVAPTIVLGVAMALAHYHPWFGLGFVVGLVFARTCDP